MGLDEFASALTLDQLRVLAAIRKEGSFTGAGRALKRSHASISYHVSLIEEQLEIPLFDRTVRPPSLTHAGQVLMRQVERVLGEVTELRTLAWSLGHAHEAMVRVALDVLFPANALAEILGRFAESYPRVDLRVHTGVVEFAGQQIAQGRADVGVSPPVDAAQDQPWRPSTRVTMVPVVAPHHPLSKLGAISESDLARHVHLVHAREPPAAVSPAMGVMSPLRWQLGDAATQMALLRAGLGWCRLPDWRAEAGLADGSLVALEMSQGLRSEVPLRVIWAERADLGPAARWLIEAFQISGPPSEGGSDPKP